MPETKVMWRWDCELSPECECRRGGDVSGKDVRRQGFLTHELRNHLQTATLALQLVKSDKTDRTAGALRVLERSLRGMSDLIDRSLSEVRLIAGTHRRERIRLADFIAETEIIASMEAANCGLRFTVDRVERGLHVDVDRQRFASAISNLLQNAFKFTRPLSHVRLRTRAQADRVSIEIEDECGGLLPGATDALFLPFEQRGPNHAGLGLGLAISRQAIEADGGEISVRDIPGRGCVFIVEMPLAPSPAATSPGGQPGARADHSNRPAATRRLQMKVIIGVDDSPYSDVVVRYVCEAVWPKGTSFLVLSAVSPIFPGPGEATAPQAITELMEQQQEYHGEIAERAADRLRLAGLTVKGRMALGDPRAVLEETARSERADLIVVGSHGRSGLKRLLLGSVASHVVTHAGCPVLVVKSPSWSLQEADRRDLESEAKSLAVVSVSR